MKLKDRPAQLLKRAGPVRGGNVHVLATTANRAPALRKFIDGRTRRSSQVTAGEGRIRNVWLGVASREAKGKAAIPPLTVKVKIFEARTHD